MQGSHIHLTFDIWNLSFFFLVLRMLTAKLAILRVLDPFFNIFLILGGSVILSFTLTTNQRYNFLHFTSPNT